MIAVVRRRLQGEGRGVYAPRMTPTRIATCALALALVAGFAAPSAAQVTTRNLLLVKHFDDWPGPSTADNYSACYGYVHPDGREYAIIGVYSGVGIYNVTDPENAYQVGFIPGPPCLWREMKSYRNWIYVSTECRDGVSDGMQIIRMTDPEHPVLAGTYTVNFITAHTVSVDTTRAVLIYNGTRNTSGQQTGMRILSLASPESPTELTWWPGGAIPMNTNTYSHDSLPLGNRLYVSSIYTGFERILDFTNPAAPFEIYSWTYPGGFTHNSWPDVTQSYLYVTDETQGQPLKIFDISTVTSPTQVNAITSNPQAIVHNARVKGNELYLSNYTEGIRILDISDPVHPAEFAYADSWPGLSGGFWGVWDVYPYFPSGTVIASDMQTGLYVYRPVRDYGIVRARVEDGQTQGPLAGTMVKLTTTGDSLATTADGIVQFAPNPGSWTVRATRFGYDAAEVSGSIVTAERDTIVLSLAPKTTTAWGGVLRDRSTGNPIADGEVDLLFTPLKAASAADGAFSLSGIPVDDYLVFAGRPGYVPIRFARRIDTDAVNQDFSLAPAATYDNLETATAWTVGAAGDNASSGIWTRVTPLGTGEPQASPAGALATDGHDLHLRPQAAQSCSCGEGGCVRASPCACGCATASNGGEEASLVPGDVAPATDRTPAPGTMCFVTGQGTSPSTPSEADVDGGKTTLTSPALDLAGMTDPTIGFWRWFYATQADPNDWFVVQLSNNGGASYTTVDTLRERRNKWEEVTIHVAPILPATSNMRVRFIAADLGPGSIVEAEIGRAHV